MRPDIRERWLSGSAVSNSKAAGRGQEFVEPTDRVLANAGEKITQMGFRLKAVKLGGCG
jgi:hypothetical protein